MRRGHSAQLQGRTTALPFPERQCILPLQPMLHAGCLDAVRAIDVMISSDSDALLEISEISETMLSSPHAAAPCAAIHPFQLTALLLQVKTVLGPQGGALWVGLSQLTLIPGNDSMWPAARNTFVYDIIEQLLMCK